MEVSLIWDIRADSSGLEHLARYKRGLLTSVKKTRDLQDNREYRENKLYLLM